MKTNVAHIKHNKSEKKDRGRGRTMAMGHKILYYVYAMFMCNCV